MSTLKDRVLAAMAHSGKTPTDIARACKIKLPSISGWTSGKTQSLKAHTAIAAAQLMGVNATWLSTGRGEMLPGVPGVEEQIADYKAQPIDRVEHLLDAIECVLALAQIRPDFFGKREKLTKTLLNEMQGSFVVNNSTTNNKNLHNDSQRQQGAAGEELSARVKRRPSKKNPADGKSAGGE